MQRMSRYRSLDIGVTFLSNKKQKPPLKVAFINSYLNLRFLAASDFFFLFTLGFS